MNYSNIRITLDMQHYCSGVSIPVKKNDIGRKIHITLMDDGIPYSIAEDCVAAFTAEKPDRNIVYEECPISGNTIVYEVSDQVAAVEGRHDCEIKLYGADGKLLTSSCFDIVVHDTVYEDGDVVETPSRPTRVLFAPDGCQVGQLLKVSKVSDDGKGTVVELASGPSATGENNTLLEEYPDADARARFVQAMQEKADSLGLDIEIAGPAGYPDNNYSNGKSMAKLYTIANGYHELAKIWNTPHKVLYTKDVESAIDLYSSVFYTDSSHFASDLTRYYFMHGGKTGTTGSGNKLLGCIMKAPDDRQFAAWLSTKVMTESTGNSRHACMKLLMDIAYALYKDPDADVSEMEADMIDRGVMSATVMLIPQTANLMNYECFDFFESETVEGAIEATLDDVAWGGKTYREIFLTGNMFSEVSAITEADNSGWSQYSNLSKPTPTTAHYNTGPNAWNCSGTKSVQMSKDLSLPNGNNFYIACKRKLASYTAGNWLGIEVYYLGGAGRVISDTVDANSVSETFETLSHTFTPKTATTQIWIGSGGAANLTGYIDDVVCVNMTELFGSDVPTKEQMNGLYENFLKLYKGETVNGLVERYKHEYPVYEYRADDRVNIASNTKTLTAITALDYIDNLDEYLTIKASDIRSGSGPAFKGGERMTMRDALYALMLPSSNTCAYAIARVIGNKLLNTYRY